MNTKNNVERTPQEIQEIIAEAKTSLIKFKSVRSKNSLNSSKKSYTLNYLAEDFELPLEYVSSMIKIACEIDNQTVLLDYDEMDFLFQILTCGGAITGLEEDILNNLTLSL